MTPEESLPIITERIVRLFEPVRLILFGSLARGDAKPCMSIPENQRACLGWLLADWAVSSRYFDEDSEPNMEDAAVAFREACAVLASIRADLGSRGVE